jgi:hypothetical protein
MFLSNRAPFRFARIWAASPIFSLSDPLALDGPTVIVAQVGLLQIIADRSHKVRTVSAENSGGAAIFIVVLNSSEDLIH